MEKRRGIITFIWVMSLLALPLSGLPNRIVLGLLLLWFFAKNKDRSLRVYGFKFFGGLSILLIILSSWTNHILSKELLLLLSVSAQGFFLLIIRPSSQVFKKGFNTAMVTTVSLLLLLKIIEIVRTGIVKYFDQDQWWNNWHYKSLTEPLLLHPTYFSLFLLAGLVMLLFGTASISLKDKINRHGLALLVFYLVSIWLVSSKIALIALALLLLIFWIQKASSASPKHALLTGLLIAVAITLPFASPSIRYRVMHELKNSLQDLPAETPNRITERRALWKSSFIEMDRHPIAGTSFRGIESREAIYPKAKFFYAPLEKPMNGHNNFIEFGLRYGIIFGVLLLLSSIFGIYKAFQMGSIEILGFGLVLLIMSMTESFLFREQGLSLASLMVLFYYFTIRERNI